MFKRSLFAQKINCLNNPQKLKSVLFFLKYEHKKVLLKVVGSNNEILSKCQSIKSILV